MWFSPTQGDKLNNSAPFATVALAGHILTGGAYCEGDPPFCGHPYDGLTMSQQQADEFTDQSADSYSGTLLLALSLLMWLKARQ
jgi:hypothetical protein